MHKTLKSTEEKRHGDAQDKPTRRLASQHQGEIHGCEQALRGPHRSHAKEERDTKTDINREGTQDQDGKAHKDKQRQRDAAHPEEGVHAREQALRGPCDAVQGGDSVINDDLVGQVGGHDEVVLHHKGGLLGMQDEPLDHLHGANSAQRSVPACFQWWGVRQKDYDRKSWTKDGDFGSCVETLPQVSDLNLRDFATTSKHGS